MEGGHEQASPILPEHAAQPGDRGGGLEQRLCRQRSQRNDDSGADGVNLTQQEAEAAEESAVA